MKLKLKIGDKAKVKKTGSETGEHRFKKGNAVEIIDLCDDNTDEAHYQAKNISTGAVWWVTDSEIKCV